MLRRIDVHIILFGLLAGYVLFVYCYTFNYEAAIDNAYLLLTLATAACLLKVTVTKDRQFFSSPACTVLLVLASVALLTPLGNEHLFNLLSLALIAALLWSADRSQSKKVIGLLLLFFLAEVFTGMMQLLYDPGWTGLSLKGSFGNTGVYAGYLVINLPFLNYSYATAFAQKKAHRWVLALVVALYGYTLLVICMVGARAAFVAFAFVLISLLLKKENRKISRTVLLSLWVSLPLAGLLALSVWRSPAKTGSLYGRLLMLRVAQQHWSDRFWQGIGVGNFPWYYPQWQAAWFRDHPLQPSHFLATAGESYLVFNEFIVLFKELGVLGFLAFVLVLLRFYLLRPAIHAAWLKTAKLTVSAILILALFSYPFHVAFILLVFILCVTSAFVSCRINVNMTFANLILAVLVIVSAGRQTWAVLQWKRIPDDPQLSFRQKKANLQRLLPVLKYDGKFLVTSGTFLSQDPASLEEAVTLLEASKRFSVSYLGYLNTANCYMFLGDYKKAIENLEFLSFFIPSRFLPKYELMRSYVKLGDSVHAEQLAHTILGMPIKIASPEVTQMREYANHFLLADSCRHKK